MLLINLPVLICILGIAILLIFVESQKSKLPVVLCTTTKGPLYIEVHEDWSPIGAKRFLDLVKDGFYSDIAFYRCVKKFLTQFGISDKPEMKHWHYDNIPDDPNLHLGIKKHYVSFAGGGPNTRSTQIFIAFEDLDFLGKEPWETPFGKVIDGDDTLDGLYTGYGDIPPFGKGPNQQKIHNQGNKYVRENFPEVDFLQSCEMVRDEETSVPILLMKESSMEESSQVSKDIELQGMQNDLDNPHKESVSPINEVPPHSQDQEEVVEANPTTLDIPPKSTSNNATFQVVVVLFVVLLAVYLYILYNENYKSITIAKDH